MTEAFDADRHAHVLSEELQAIRKVRFTSEYQKLQTSARSLAMTIMSAIRGGYVVLVTFPRVLYEDAVTDRVAFLRPDLGIEQTDDMITVPVSGSSFRAETAGSPGNHLSVNVTTGKFTLSEFDGSNLVGAGSLTFDLSDISEISIREAQISAPSEEAL